VRSLSRCAKVSPVPICILCDCGKYGALSGMAPLVVAGLCDRDAQQPAPQLHSPSPCGRGEGGGGDANGGHWFCIAPPLSRKPLAISASAASVSISATNYLQATLALTTSVTWYRESWRMSSVPSDCSTLVGVRLRIRRASATRSSGVRRAAEVNVRRNSCSSERPCRSALRRRASQRVRSDFSQESASCAVLISRYYPDSAEIRKNRLPNAIDAILLH
jgi:hypothetical protein